jgi:polyphosphate glucokinase
MKTSRAKKSVRSILVIDVGGSHVKVMTSTARIKREFESGPNLTARQMVREVKTLTKDWSYDVISIGYPGPVCGNRPLREPFNLGKGWTGFDFRKAFGKPTKVVNDALMQALGGYRGGRMLFLGLGTGLGSAMIADGELEPMELGHLPYRKGKTYEDYAGEAGRERRGDKKWRKHITDIVKQLTAALEPDEVLIGGGNVERLDKLPPKSRRGDNADAFEGGFRLWVERRWPVAERDEEKCGAVFRPHPASQDIGVDRDGETIQNRRPCELEFRSGPRVRHDHRHPHRGFRLQGPHPPRIGRRPAIRNQERQDRSRRSSQGGSA